MDVFNKLSINLQETILHKIFKEQKNIYKKIIKSISLLHNNNSYGINHPYYDVISNLNITYCDYCNKRSHIKNASDIPYYNSNLYKNNAYKTKKTFYKYYMKRYLERAIKNFRCSWEYNSICYSCYHGYSKKPIKMFI